MNRELITTIIVIGILIAIKYFARDKFKPISIWDFVWLFIIGSGIVVLAYSDWPWLIYIALPLVLIFRYLLRRNKKK